MQLLLVLLLIALVAEALENERRRTVAADLLHAARKALDVKYEKARQNFKGNRTVCFGVAAALITAKVILDTKVFARYTRVLKEVK